MPRMSVRILVVSLTLWPTRSLHLCHLRISRRLRRGTLLRIHNPQRHRQELRDQGFQLHHHRARQCLGLMQDLHGVRDNHRARQCLRYARPRGGHGDRGIGSLRNLKLGVSLNEPSLKPQLRRECREMKLTASFGICLLQWEASGVQRV